MLMVTLDRRLVTWLSLTQTPTAAKFCLFSCRATTKPKTIVILGPSTPTTLLLAIQNNTIPKTNSTDAGRLSSWQHLDGMQKPDCIQINSTFSCWLDEPEYRLARALVCRTFRLDHSAVHDHQHSIPHTTYRILPTTYHIKHHVTIAERYETNIVKYRLLQLLSFLNCVTYVCQSLSTTS